MNSSQLKIKIFADGANLETIRQLRSDPLIKGFTTNPTLMKQAGVSDYITFSRNAIEIINGLPISLEVFSDDLAEMKRQALILSALGDNVFVKIPVTNSEKISTAPLVKELSMEGVQLNVTAMFTIAQTEIVLRALQNGPRSYISIFAGRIADAGVDPMPIMIRALELLEPEPQIELIWASPREVLNIVQADSIGCHVITVTHDLLKKLPGLGKDLDQFSLETVEMFTNDARNAGYRI